ncbi:cytochrome P450 [Flagelloscypha sp. PMI_526]|nr:cytochrome P450 [Flagelloscypha sp. PMI_526]
MCSTREEVTLRIKPPSATQPKGSSSNWNLLDMPSKEEWKTFSEWGRKYGLYLLRPLGQVMIIVNKPSMLEDLEKHGSRFSSRPYMPMAGELCGYAQSLVLGPYAPRWKNERRMVAKVIGSTAANEKHARMELLETTRFLSHVLSNPEALESHVRRTSGAIILKLTYGIEVRDEDDPFVNLIKDALDGLSVAAQPGAWLVDVAPGLMNAWPEFLLIGGGFKAVARKVLARFNDIVEIPFAETQNQIANHTAPPSLVADLLNEKPDMAGEELYDLKYAAASMYGGGADTTASAQYAFFLAMELFPEVQAKAQQEIDSVIGRDRLIRLSDRTNLPYVAAVVTEALRWNSVLPTGVPHVATESGVVGGYSIPKGAMIITNLCATRETCSERPSLRMLWLGSPGICPGMHLAEATVFLMIANALASFHIAKAVDENGMEITPVHENMTGLVSHPKPFTCSIKPRHEKVSALIAEECRA